MTAPRRNNQTTSGFSDWVRSVPELDSRNAGVANMDIDWIWHQYRVIGDQLQKNRRVNHIMFIEEKRFGTDLAFAQRDTMFLIHQAMKDLKRSRLLKNARMQTVRVKFWGYHKLRYSGDSPGTSDRIWWNKREIDVDTLVSILRFDLRPDNLATMDDRGTHHRLNQTFFDFSRGIGLPDRARADESPPGVFRT